MSFPLKGFGFVCGEKCLETSFPNPYHTGTRFVSKYTDTMVTFGLACLCPSQNKSSNETQTQQYVLLHIGKQDTSKQVKGKMKLCSVLLCMFWTDTA